jgi:hypothetical protein
VETQTRFEFSQVVDGASISKALLADEKRIGMFDLQVANDE